MKTLGIVINNKCTNLSSHFDVVIDRIRTIRNQWSRLSLSLPGRIAISKTMLISQIGYGASIFTPTHQQLTIMQDIIDGYVTNGIVIAKDRYYLTPKFGGLGLIDLSDYCPALQCSWMKRCLFKINDSWRWNLAASCNFNLDLIREEDISAEQYPILHNIAASIKKLQLKYWLLNEKIFSAPLVDNRFFLRAAPESRAPVRGCVDSNLL